MVSRRERQAEQTRAEILRAARTRFASDGYASTSLKNIAADAGVSVQTLYDSVGQMADLVRRLNDLIDAEADVASLVAVLRTSTDPAEVIRVPARITRRLIEQCGDIMRAALAASLTDPGLLPVIHEGQHRHRAGAAMVADRLHALKALPRGIAVDQAATSIAALSDFRLALVLLDDHGLDLDHVETWIGDTTARSVLRPATR